MTLRIRVVAHGLRSASKAADEAEIVVARTVAALRVLDALEDAGVHVGAFSCRSARCGACLARVDDPSAALVPAAEEERATLAALSADPRERLACQLVLGAGAAGELSVYFRR